MLLGMVVKDRQQRILLEEAKEKVSEVLDTF